MNIDKCLLELDTKKIPDLPRAGTIWNVPAPVGVEFRKKKKTEFYSELQGLLLKEEAW